MDEWATKEFKKVMLSLGKVDVFIGDWFAMPCFKIADELNLMAVVNYPGTVFFANMTLNLQVLSSANQCVCCGILCQK